MVFPEALRPGLAAGNLPRGEGGVSRVPARMSVNQGKQATCFCDPSGVEGSQWHPQTEAGPVGAAGRPQLPGQLPWAASVPRGAPLSLRVITQPPLLESRILVIVSLPLSLGLAQGRGPPTKDILPHVKLLKLRLRYNLQSTIV